MYDQLVITRPSGTHRTRYLLGPPSLGPACSLLSANLASFLACRIHIWLRAHAILMRGKIGTRAQNGLIFICARGHTAILVPTALTSPRISEHAANRFMSIHLPHPHLLRTSWLMVIEHMYDYTRIESAREEAPGLWHEY